MKVLVSTRVFGRKQYEEVGREWDKMSKLPESGEPWTLTILQWDVVAAALQIAAETAAVTKEIRR
jgi:hypothetical protein